MLWIAWIMCIIHFWQSLHQNMCIISIMIYCAHVSSHDSNWMKENFLNMVLPYTTHSCMCQKLSLIQNVPAQDKKMSNKLMKARWHLMTEKWQGAIEIRCATVAETCITIETDTASYTHQRYLSFSQVWINDVRYLPASTVLNDSLKLWSEDGADELHKTMEGCVNLL